MGNFSRAFYSVPRADGILFCRFVNLVLSASGIAVYATTLNIYRTQIAPTDSSIPLNDNLLTTNSVPIVPLSISLIWSLLQLTLLFRRIQYAYWQNKGDPVFVSEEHEEGDSNRELVHPGWDFGIDFVCAVFLLVMSVLTGEESGNWKAGKLNDEVNGTVDLKACPSVDQVTGMLNYWCEPAWNTLVGLTSAGVSIMGTDTGIHFSRFFVACYGLYQLRRRHHTEEIHKNLPADEHTATPADKTHDIQLK